MARESVALFPLADPRTIAAAREALAQGGVLGIPTESSYGLAVDPMSAPGVDWIYRLKERERGKPLPIVLGALEQAATLGVDLQAPLIEWAAGHWPAALSVVVPVKAGAPEVPAAAGLGSLALRIPDHPGLRGLISGIGHPLTATSANLSGQSAIQDPRELLDWLSGLEDRPPLLVVDGGPLAGGLPSTVVVSRAGRPFVTRRGRVDLVGADGP